MMGLASGLHCAGMCGSIASAITFTFAADASRGSRARTLLLTQVGRVLAYAGAGALLGAFGSGLAGAFDQALAYRMLRWAAALTLGWIGLSTARLLPPLASFDRFAAPIGQRIVALSPMGPASAGLPALATGVAWGFMPCAMVYGALFTALLTGSGPGGFALMLGFGLGTLPAVVATAFAVTSVRDLGRSPLASAGIGLSIAGYGLLSLLIGPAGTVLCLPIG
ncbi:MAG: sulfite exporter TauE/SafE family protein [Phreatobacter sp.]